MPELGSRMRSQPAMGLEEGICKCVAGSEWAIRLKLAVKSQSKPASLAVFLNSRPLRSCLVGMFHGYDDFPSRMSFFKITESLSHVA